MRPRQDGPAFTASSYSKDLGLPNTLCHIALQGSLHKTLFTDRGLLWVVIGCIVPDIPWIILRISLALAIADPYQLRLYTTILASLPFCILAAAVLAQFAARPVLAFALLSVNCLLHLLLDATQIKYANGVHLTAPFDWTALHLDLFRLDHPLGLPLTVAGLFLLLWQWPKIGRQCHWADIVRPVRQLTAALCLSLYLFVPLSFTDDLERSDFHYLRTLKDKANRVGKYVEFDRVAHDARLPGVRLFSGEWIRVTGTIIPGNAKTISIRGRFTTPDTVQVINYQVNDRSRDLASMAGIFLACLLMGQTVIVSRYFSFIPTKDRTHAQNTSNHHSPYRLLPAGYLRCNKDGHHHPQPSGERDDLNGSGDPAA
jgi:hypothetical protein